MKKAARRRLESLVMDYGYRCIENGIKLPSTLSTLCMPQCQKQGYGYAVNLALAHLMVPLNRWPSAGHMRIREG